MKVVLVEDDIILGKELKKMLEYYSYTVIWVTHGLDVINIDEDIDIYLLDILLPDISGFDLCKKIRMTTESPIILLTALDDEEDIIYGFKQGANDYVVKPFSFRILHMRIQSLLRLYKKDLPEIIKCDSLEIDLENKVVFKDGINIRLRKIEFEILTVLLKNEGRICTREYLLDYLYDLKEIEMTTLTVHISRLRKVIGKEYIETIYGYGYRWIKEIVNE